MRAREPLRKHTDVMLLGKFAEIGCCESSDRQISAVGDAMAGSKSKVILASWKCWLFKYPTSTYRGFGAPGTCSMDPLFLSHSSRRALAVIRCRH